MRPATRSRLRPWLLITVALLTAIYFFTGPHSTQTSEIYKSTLAAMDAKRRATLAGVMGAGFSDKAAAAQVAAEEKVRSGAGKEIVFDKVADHDGGKGEQVSHKIATGGQQSPQKDGKPLQAPLSDEDGAIRPKTPPKVVGGKVNDKVFEKDGDAADSVHGPADDDSAPARGKKVKGKVDDNDGVAKVGNTGQKAVESTALESPAERHVSMLLDEILKKSPGKSSASKYQVGTF